MQGINENVELIAENSTLSLTEIKKIREILINQLNEAFNFDRFYQSYKKNILTNLSQVNFLGLGISSNIKRKTKNLNDLFVQPIFKKNNGLEKKINQEIYKPMDEKKNIETHYCDLFNEDKFIVIIGKPGSGKSLLIKSIVCDILVKSRIFCIAKV